VLVDNVLIEPYTDIFIVISLQNKIILFSQSAYVLMLFLCGKKMLENDNVMNYLTREHQVWLNELTQKTNETSGVEIEKQIYVTSGESFNVTIASRLIYSDEKPVGYKLNFVISDLTLIGKILVIDHQLNVIMNNIQPLSLWIKKMKKMDSEDLPMLNKMLGSINRQQEILDKLKQDIRSIID
jgi:ribosomal protein L11